MPHTDDTDEKRTIDELIVRYEVEPSLKDVFVEGFDDKTLIEQFLLDRALDDVAVYEISSVEVPVEALAKLHLESNNRGRVISLAFGLYEGSAADLSTTVACIADSDFDYLLKKRYDCPLLLFTDFTSIEIYLAEEEVLDKFLTVVIRRFPHDAASVLANLKEALCELFLIRLANQELQLGIAPLPLKKFCSVEQSEVRFDRDKYIFRYLLKGRSGGRRDVFSETIERYRKRLSQDFRLHIHGHDFIELLFFYISEVKGAKPTEKFDFFGRSLFGVVESKHLEEQKLFKELISRFA